MNIIRMEVVIIMLLCAAVCSIASPVNQNKLSSGNGLSMSSKNVSGGDEAGGVLRSLSDDPVRASDVIILSENQQVSCNLTPLTPHLYEEITQLFKYDAKLVEYIIEFQNYTDGMNPMVQGAREMYKANRWARVGHSHGKTILSLAFNYGILSLMTLSFGVIKKNIELAETPWGCLLKLNESDRIQVVLNLMLRDFRPEAEINVFEGEGVCHQIIKQQGAFAKFTDQCCYKNRITEEIVCEVDAPNKWLKVLEYLIASFTLVIFLFAPMLLTKFFYAQTLDVVRYIVKLKEPMYKTMCVCRGNVNVKVMSKHVLDFRNRKRFFRSKQLVRSCPEDTVIPIKITEYDILVNYAKLLPENTVPVGVTYSLSNAIFMCKLNEIEAFNDCCEANALGCLRETRPLPWLRMCTVLGRVVLVLFMPFPFYVRLACYYLFENPEVMDRKAAADNLGLEVWFEYRLMQYLTPVHPVFITVYITYLITGMTYAVVSTMKHKSRFHKIVTDSLKDLLNMSWLSSLEMLVKNILWPFKKMGLFGILLGLIYWPLVIPICALACLFFCIPIVFFSFRLLCHALGVATTDDPATQKPLPGELKAKPTGVQIIEADELLENFTQQGWRKNRLVRQVQKVGIARMIMNTILAFVCIGTVLSATLMFTEVVVFILNICVFTMMGLIVNASKVLKYGTLIVLVVLYSYDCFNDVYKQYLKLNKALFSEIKGRIKDIMEVTSLPSHLQENRGFKAVEVSEQADYESPDDITKEKSYHWIINDLVLFVDNDDFPRIPKRLFEDVCTITVPGSPGPVYLSLLFAGGKFLAIIVFLVFVFIVVLSFGNVYQMSGTNQMLATMAGGFAPMMFSKVLKPATPDIELGSVSFKSKLEEIITNFWQMWPMFDFPFELGEKEEEEEEDDGSDDDKSDKGKGKDKDKKKDKKDEKKKKESKAGSMFDLSAVDRSFTEQDIKQRLSEMKTPRPADGQFVDLVIILPGKDVPDSEWLMEWSDISDYDIPQEDTMPNGLTVADEAV